MDIKKIEEAIGATHIGEYAPGYTRAKILRFQDGNNLKVVKYAESDNQLGVTEINNNILGYELISKISMDTIPSFTKITIGKDLAIVMPDLGGAISIDSNSIELLIKFFRETTIKTVGISNGSNLFFDEINEKIKQFIHSGIPELLAHISRNSIPIIQNEEALMLLDFTPKNVFLGESNYYFIDPWIQSTYMGNPAVSLGQFYEYLTRDQKITSGANRLRTFCLFDLPQILRSDFASMKTAFQWGQTLELILSSYEERKINNISASEEYIRKAYVLWQ